MALYRYRAKKGADEITENRIEAANEREAIEQLSRMGYTPLNIKEEKEGSRFEEAGPKRFAGRIKSSEVTIFSRQLASLLKAGVPILSAIDIIAEQTESRSFKTALFQIRNAIKDGATFSSTLSRFPSIFSPLYISMVRTGEDSGALPSVLLKIADYRSKQEEVISRFRMAMAYPILMALVGVATIVFMLTFVMPRLMRIFTNLGQQLPLPTRILISTSQGLRQWWFWIIIILSIIILLIKREARTKGGRLFFSYLAIHFPLTGKFVLKSELARFSRTLELLIKNGVPILRALDIAIPVLENELIKNQLRQSYLALEQGASFGKTLKGSGVFPLFMSNLIIVGEEAGKLEEALSEVAVSYERDTDEAMKVMAGLLEPLMILVMGLIVGFIVVAMLLPLFEINMMT